MPRINLMIGLEDAYGRAVARGVIRYAKTRPAWKLYGYERLFSSGDGELAPDGIIARVESLENARELAGRGIPVVDVAGAYPGVGLLEAYNDDEAGGRRAGSYLRGLGFRSFAFCGVEGTAWSRRRLQGFAEAVAAEPGAMPCFARPLPWWKDRFADRQALDAWLRALPKPAGLFAANDIAGLRTVEACRDLGIPVPAALAVLGVDDEDLFCELADPSLSSVRLDCEGIGRAAAELLDAALAPERAAAFRRERRIAPGDVVERDSTRTLVHDDPLIVQAVSWLRANAQREVNVADLAAALPVSRRTLENRFRRALGTSPHQALDAYRLEAAKRLLATTDEPIDTVAESSGFKGAQRFYRAFKAAEGVTPGAWRRRQEAGPLP